MGREVINPEQLGLAVRREWPDGSHELFGFTLDVRKAAKWAERDWKYWQRPGAPAPPARVELVHLTRLEFEMHRVVGRCSLGTCTLVGEVL